MSEIDKMLRFLHLDGPAADVLRELAVFRTVPRRTQLTEPDSDHHLVSFMVSGLLRGYLLDDRGGEITECFSFQYGDLRINSLDWERGHLDQYVETLEETAFVSFDLDELMPHILSYPELTAIFVRRISEDYAEQSCHRRILVHTSAAEQTGVCCVYDCFQIRYFCNVSLNCLDDVSHKISSVPDNYGCLSKLLPQTHA